MWNLPESSRIALETFCPCFQRLQAGETTCAEAVDGASVGMDIDAPSQAEGSAPAENGIFAGLLCLRLITCVPCHLLAVLCARCELCTHVSSEE